METGREGERERENIYLQEHKPAPLLCCADGILQVVLAGDVLCQFQHLHETFSMGRR